MSFKYRNVSRKDQPATCPFCDQRVPRPAPFEQQTLDGCEGARCSCGALYVADVTGKSGGQALVDGLTLIAAGDEERGMQLTAGVDYELKTLGYRPRTHSIETRMPRRGGGFGLAKLFFFRRLDGSA